MKSLAFWRSPRANVPTIGRKPRIFRPWQIRQWLGLDDKGKPRLLANGQPWIPESQKTRQRYRAAIRMLAFKQVNEKYGQEPRHARRGIALVWAKKAWQQYKESAQ
jgi:hypothetical protein